MNFRESKYYLVIHTDSYAENFERELISYCIGIIPPECGDYAKTFEKIFWNNEVSSSINSYEEYKKSIEEKKKVFGDCDISEDKFTYFYENYLVKSDIFNGLFHYDSFYDLDFYYNQNSLDLNTICIFLNEIPDERFEEILVRRIKNFFDKNVYKVVKDFECLSQFEELSTEKGGFKLLDLELIDKDKNLIKKYV